MEESERKRNRRKRMVVPITALALLTTVAIYAGIGSGVQGGPPDFEMVAYQGEGRLGGEELNFSELLGRDQPVVLNFWAALCPPCRQEMPGFQRVHDELGQEFILVGVDIGPFIGLGSHDQARDFLREYSIEYPTAYALSSDPVREYEVRGMPTTLFFGSDGEIVKKHTGYLPEGQLRREIQALVAGTE